MIHRVFAYGTLAIPQVIAVLTGAILSSVSADAPHYARFLLNGKPYPGMCRRDGAVTSGRLYRNINDESLRLMDEFEDDVYEREAIIVTPRKESAVSAWAYVIPKHDELRLGLKCWDEDVFMEKWGESYIAMCLRVREGYERKVGKEVSR